VNCGAPSWHLSSAERFLQYETGCEEAPPPAFGELG